MAAWFILGTVLSIDDEPEDPNQNQVATRGLQAGMAVGPYTLVERLQSLPRTLEYELPELEGRSGGPLQVLRSDWSDERLAELAAADYSADSEYANGSLAWPEGGRQHLALPWVHPLLNRPAALPRPFLDELDPTARRYRLHQRVGRGSHGEVWRAVRRDDVHGTQLILKALHSHGGGFLSGLRERYFGELLRGQPRVARFLDAFEEGGTLWLVFRDEGLSLHSLLYSTRVAHGSLIVQPSAFWLQLRRDRCSAPLRHLVRESLEAVAHCHTRNVTHRDLKPANIIVAIDETDPSNQLPALRVADFGSAVDAKTLQVRRRPAGTPSAPSAHRAHRRRARRSRASACTTPLGRRSPRRRRTTCRPRRRSATCPSTRRRPRATTCGRWAL